MRPQLPAPSQIAPPRLPRSPLYCATRIPYCRRGGWLHGLWSGYDPSRLSRATTSGFPSIKRCSYCATATYWVGRKRRRTHIRPLAFGFTGRIGFPRCLLFRTGPVSCSRTPDRPPHPSAVRTCGHRGGLGGRGPLRDRYQQCQGVGSTEFHHRSRHAQVASLIDDPNCTVTGIRMQHATQNGDK